MIYDEPMLPDWSRYHPQDFEALVTRLLRRIHPTGYRPDGTGGDGGRDFVVPSATGNLIYQVKHYTGRMTSSRRKKVHGSIDAVAADRLSGWVLVVPIDPTEGEMEWFSNATRELGVPCLWYGSNWLDTELPRHPDLLVTQFGTAGSARARVQDGLLTIGNDVVDLDDVLTAQARLDSTADLLTPDFHVRTISTDDGPTISITPRPGTSIGFDLAEIERHAGPEIVDAIRFGEPTTFEAPAQLFGLPESLSGTAPVEWSVRGEDGPPVEVRLQALRAGGRVINELRFEASRPTIGIEGAHLECSDRSGWVGLALRLPQPPATHVTLTLSWNSGRAAYPDDLVTLFDFVDALQDAPQLGLVFRIDSKDHRFVPVPTPDVVTNAVDVGYESFVRDMDELQRITNTRHQLSIDHPDIDPQTVNGVVRKLNGETIEIDAVLTASFIRIVDDLVVGPDSGNALVIDRTLEAIEVQDERYPLDVLERVTCSHVLVENYDDVLAARENGEGCDVRFRPADGQRWKVTFGPAPAQ